jgi:hypothetical protein
LRAQQYPRGEDERRSPVSLLIELGAGLRFAVREATLGENHMQISEIGRFCAVDLYGRIQDAILSKRGSPLGTLGC